MMPVGVGTVAITAGETAGTVAITAGETVITAGETAGTVAMIVLTIKTR